MRALGVLLCAAPGVAVAAFLWSLDLSVPMLDHWHQLDWYARLAAGDLHWTHLFEPHGGIHIPVSARVVLTPLAFATGWSLRAEALLNVIIVFLTLVVASRIAPPGEAPLGRRCRSAVDLSMAFLLFSPVIWWAWVWTIAFLHFVVNAAVVTTAWALAPASGALDRRRFAIALFACSVASLTRFEGLWTWWIFVPCLLHALSGTSRQARVRGLAIWLGAGGLHVALSFWAWSALAADGGEAQALAAAFAPWGSFVIGLNQLGAPLAGFLQSVLPDLPDTRRYAAAGAFVLFGYLALSIHCAVPRRAHLLPAALPWMTIGLFGVAFAMAIGIGRLPVLESGLLTPAYVSTYAVAPTLTTISVIQLGVLALGDRREALAPAPRPSRRAFAWAGIGLVGACLLANYLAIVPGLLDLRRRWQGREVCFELAGYLAARNSCFVIAPVPIRPRELRRAAIERSERLVALGFRPLPRRDLVRVEAPSEGRGVLQRAGLGESGEFLWVHGQLAPGGVAGERTILLTWDDQHRFSARGVGDGPGRDFALAVPSHLLPRREVRVRAWVYEPEHARFVRMEGEVRVGNVPARRR